MSRICLMCNSPFELAERMFEAKLIDDESFCGRCFSDILNEDNYHLEYLNGLLVEVGLD